MFKSVSLCTVEAVAVSSAGFWHWRYGRVAVARRCSWCCVKKRVEVVNWGCIPVGKWLSRHEISMGYLPYIYTYIHTYIYNSIKIHNICTLQVAYGMVLIHLETGSHHREPHDGRLGQHPRFPMDISIFWLVISQVLGKDIMGWNGTSSNMFGNIPSGYAKIAIEHGHRNSFDLPIKHVDFP